MFTFTATEKLLTSNTKGTWTKSREFLKRRHINIDTDTVCNKEDIQKS